MVMFFLTVNAEPNLLMEWIVTNDVVRSQVVAIGFNPVYIIKSKVIALDCDRRG